MTRFGTRIGRYVVTAAAAWWLVSGAPSLADNDFWKTAVSGSWGAGLNWVDGSTPSSIFDHATFNLPGAYTVSFNVDPDPIGDLALTGGANVTFASSSRPGNPIVPRTLRLVEVSDSTGSLNLFGGASLTLGATSGEVHASPNPFHLNADDEIKLTNGGTLNLRFGSTIASSVLSVGDAQLNVNGGQVQCPLSRIGFSPGNAGAIISGNNSLWQTDQLIVGQGGAGGMSISGGAQVRSNLGATIGSINGGYVQIRDEGSIWNTGSLDIGEFGRLDILPGATVISSQETIIAPRGQLWLLGGTFDTQDLPLINFEWTSGTLRVGTCHGNLFNPAGILAPGHSAGSTTINGNYTQVTGGVLEIEIGGSLAGSQFDFVNVTSSAQIGGELDLKLTGGFTPTPSQTFAILISSDLSGAFDNAPSGQRVTTTDGGGSFLVNYGFGSPFDDNQVVLSNFLTGAGLPGDYNQNGTVDAADYVLWRNGGPLANEVDTPGVVNAADYTAWRARFGNTAGSGAGLAATGSAVAAVPEPASAFLAMLAVSAFAMLRRRPLAAWPAKK